MRTLVLVSVGAIVLAQDVLGASDWPEGTDPATVSRRLSEQLLSTRPESYNPRGYRGYVYEQDGRWVNYAVWSLWVNCLANARLTKDAEREKRLVALYEPFYGPKKKVLSPWRHVDFTVQGALPLEIARLTGDKRALESGLAQADIQWAPPGEKDPVPPYNALPLSERRKWFDQGYSDQTRFWIDDMYMITFLQSQAYLATGDRKYIDRAARELCLYLRRLQRPGGLFFHAEDVPFVWGRGCGWMAAAMPMLLKYLPEDSRHRPEILSAYRKTMAALLAHQRENGLWGQLVDDPESWDETSCSAMFAYAFIEGAKHGWIDPAVYDPAARKAYLALVARLDDHGNLSDVCTGTGAFNSRAYYLQRDRAHGDPHGQAALSWVCRALMETSDAQPRPKVRRVPPPWQDLLWGEPELVNRPLDGYRGIWYMNQPTKDDYRFKYSGGMGTYCAGHLPMSVYSKAAERTYFCYGGTDAGNMTLYHCVSYFDHRTKRLADPVAVIDKHTTDAHDNPAIAVDDDGYIWLFSASHGIQRPSCISRSVRPHDITEFKIVRRGNFSYPQPHWIPGRGFLFLQTVYTGRMSGRSNVFQTYDAASGVWSEPHPFAFVEEGDYLRSWQGPDGKIGVAFDRHPKGRGLNYRTDIYYLETEDFGRTWRTADGRAVDLPVTDKDSPALVYRDVTCQHNVYIKCVRFDADSHPLVLSVTSLGAHCGPENGPRKWMIRRWTGRSWETIDTGVEGDNNYDYGELFVDGKDCWTLLAATGKGPQPWNPGGEIEAWRTADAGATWRLDRQVTRQSVRNMNYPRTPVDAQADFRAFWCDGNGRNVSESRLYYCNADGETFEMPFGADFQIRDPFILVDGGLNYLYDSKQRGDVKGVFVRMGTNLRGWTSRRLVMEIPPGVRCTDVWAPEVHRQGGRYWMFVTLTEELGSRRIVAMSEKAEHPEWLRPRGVWVFVADSPLGPFRPVRSGPVTDPSHMALDGTLYIEDGRPYLVYCHEWIQNGTGTIEYAPLADGFSALVGKPKVLLAADQAMKGAGKVTDGPFLYRSEKTGVLHLVWSNFVDGHGYCVLTRRSESGKIAGPWSNDTVLVGGNGGHGMIFKDGDGQLTLVFHRPNDDPKERLDFIRLSEDGGLEAK